MRVFTAGCFDVLTVAHINLLLFCRQIAGPTGEVIVSLDTDERIKFTKGTNRPVFDFQNRRESILALTLMSNPVVDTVVEHSDNFILGSMIRQLKVDYVVASEFYRNGGVVGDGQATITYFKNDPRFSSTKIIEACQRKSFYNEQKS